MTMRTLLILLLTTSPVAAECVTAANLTTGITFKRQDGRSGWAQSNGAVVEIDYATDPGNDWGDYREGRLGIYESKWSWYPSDEAVMGLGPGAGYDYKLAGKPPMPSAGMRWQSKVKVTASTDNGGEGGVERQSYTLKVSYTALAAKSVKLSGCTYTILPIEAHFTSDHTDLTRRWLYFPDLGFGLETRVIDHLTGEDRKLGLTTLTAKG